MSDFEYLRAHSLAEAIELLNEPGVRGRVLAGGTDLVNQHRSGQMSCDRLVDVAHVPELRTIEVNDRVNIGAAVTHAEIVESAALWQKAPLLVLACQQIGSTQIRNIATIGGNVVNAAACADTLPALVCLGTEAIIATPGGVQRLSVTDLVTGVNETSLPPGALVQAFAFELPSARHRVSYQRIGRRQAMSIARLSVAAMGSMNASGRVADVRVVPGAAFSRFRRVAAVEEILLGRQPTPDLVVEAGRCMADQFLAESGGRWSAPYKRQTIAVLTERALGEVVDL
jgi:carbon-monoxide dehydrogenase medium subunit/xanthine dehydrogenase FAD-binding subunit